MPNELSNVVWHKNLMSYRPRIGNFVKMGRNRQPSTASISDIDDIIAALLNDKVLEATGAVIETKLQSIITYLKFREGYTDDASGST